MADHHGSTDRTVAITGASGRVGREAIEALSAYDCRLFSHSEHEDIDSETLEIADRDAFSNALEGANVLIHLAANPSPRAEWDDLEGPNIDGVYNAFEAALENDLERVIFASSNHAVNGENVVDPTRVETTGGDPRVVRPDDPPSPDSYYGVTKVFGEAMGEYYARRHGLEVVNLRIGWLLDEEELREICDERDGSGERYARAMWLSPADCWRLLEATVSASLSTHAITAHGVSNNADRFLSLAETMHELEYRPRDDSSVVLDE
ncbi:NAD-dependent epimerase/dehydratase family protein [Natronosalvus caseinilyticus]|uniref:NAD-dependent epimerase/dehydratase family protein n=1 Tax=Natronosalvus caseinilyticus TaxID=2953747 RepID=UPI0028AB497F|nr:NAD(P)-dependent oxidoreductase [Natronosalvus caseinilyticus]